MVSFRLVNVSRLLPPPHLLLALIATARHGTVIRAAEELHLTASGVSRQLNELEGTYGLRLFSRVRNRLQLTEEGKRYVEGVAPLLAELERLTLELLSRAGGETSRKQSLWLSTFPTFGAKWLIPRLSDFFQRNPGVEVSFVPFTQGYDFADPKLDCAIRYGRGVWPGAKADYLAGREIALIVSPREAEGLRRPEDVHRFTRLHHASEPGGWLRWCEHHRVAHDGIVGGPQFDQVASQVQAVIAGLGIALVPRVLVEEELAGGTVVEAPFRPFTESAGYYLCYPEAKAATPSVVAFRRWALEQAAVES